MVTVVKDDAEGLARTRGSLEAQTFVAWNHIIVPSSPNDPSSLLAKSWVLEKTVVHDQVGTGIYSAMNQGLACAQDEYVVFLNAGDLFADEDSLNFVAISLKLGHPNWAVFGGYVIRDGKVISITPVLKPSPWLIGCGRANVLHPSVYYQRDFLLKLGGFEETFRIAGDLDLHIRVAKLVSPQVEQEPVSIFFAGGISSTQVFSTIFESFRARSIRFDRSWRLRVLSTIRMAHQLLRAGALGLVRIFFCRARG